MKIKVSSLCQELGTFTGMYSRMSHMHTKNYYDCKTVTKLSAAQILSIAISYLGMFFCSFSCILNGNKLLIKYITH